MAEFMPINTQEEFDERIKQRLERERATIAKQYEDYDSLKTSKQQLEEMLTGEKARSTGFESQITELTAKVRKYETDSAKTRIALENGLDIAMASRLRGDTEDEIRADAAELAKLFQQSKGAGKQPKFNPEGSVPTDKKEAAFKEMLSKINI